MDDDVLTEEEMRPVVVPAWVADTARRELDNLIDRTEDENPDPLTDRTFQARDAFEAALDKDGDMIEQVIAGIHLCLAEEDPCGEPEEASGLTCTRPDGHDHAHATLGRSTIGAHNSLGLLAWTEDHRRFVGLSALATEELHRHEKAVYGDPHA